MAESIVQLPAPTVKMHSFNRTIGANSVEDEVTLNGEPYLASYVISTSTAASTATAASHLLQIMAGASLHVYVRRIRVYQFAVATTAAIVTLQLFRLSSAGTGGTAFTPAILDGNDSASGATSMSLPTVKGTEGTLVGIAASQFIQTVPTGGNGMAPLLAEWDFDKLLRSKAIRIPAGTANGLAIKNPTAVAGASVVVEAQISEATF